VLRVAIYVPLLGFFGWQALDRFANGRAAADEAFREHLSAWLEQPTHMMLPNGDALPMLTPEQARAQGYELPPSFLESE